MVAQAENSSNGRYTLRSELAHGGMGRIFIAEDARLSRRVAVKELLEPSSGHRARFERELSLTSRLEHPSIVSVQDAGTWADGRPFYVMKLVSGESFDRTIARAATVADRIALLPHGLAVVDALAYAHAQGIVHRDLKPENILVGDFGETVVIDWGLAKDLRAATPDLVEGPYRAPFRDGETLGGEVIGTPAYMPPEQALGDAVDERADVYALGAVMYHLLSGARPHAGTTVDEILANVIKAPPPPLVTPGIPPDLIAIVDKAMARKPEDRYATAAELAVDLKRFQSGQLVGAHRYTGSELVRRWLRKHRAAVIVGALAAIVLVALGAFSVARIVREQREADAARARAEHDRALADDRRGAAEGLVTFMLGDLGKSLQPIGKLSMLELPARRALAYFDERHELAPDERLSRAVALEHLGDALHSKGDLAGAEQNIRAAIAERGRLVAEGHRDVDGSYLDASLHADLGNLLLLRGTADAIPEFRAAIDAYAALAASRPTDPRGARGQIEILARLAGLRVARDDLDGGKRDYAAAVAIARDRLRAAPDDADAQFDLTEPELGLGDVLALHGDHAGSLAAYRATYDRISAATAKAPDNMALVRVQQMAEDRLGVEMVAQQDLAGGVRTLQAAGVLAERLVTHDPDNLGLQYAQALDLGRLADALHAHEDVPGAIETYRRSIAILKSLIARDESNSEAARHCLIAEVQLGELLSEQKQWHLSEVSARDAVALGEHRLELDPSNRQSSHDLSAAYLMLGTALTSESKAADALDVFERALVLARTLATSDPKDVMAQYNLEEVLVNVGDARCAAHRDPRSAYDETLALASHHTLASPNLDWNELDTEVRARAKACRR